MRKHLVLAVVMIGVLAALTNPSADPVKNFHISSAQVTPRVLNFIKDSYIDIERASPAKMLKGALDHIQKNVAEVLVIFEENDKFTVIIDKAVKKFSPSALDNFGDLWAVLKDVYTFIEVHYHGTVELQDIEYLAIEGMLDQLDPHSNILTPKVFNEFKIGTKGKFGGIGVVIETKEGELTIVAPIEDTPAWRAGIKAGDKIVQIGEESTINMSLTEAVEKMRGDVGTSISLMIARKGRISPFAVALKRAVINIESVQTTTIHAAGRSIGYVKIKSFQEDTDKEFGKQLALLRKDPAFAGLILDLRNNPGGLLNQAVAIADKFMDSGVIVSTIGAGNKLLEEDPARTAGNEPPYPLVVLINEGSASASEIVAGALQVSRKAVIVGNQTFGKGSVQTIYDLNDGSALKLTIAEYLTGGKNSIQSVGVTPDVKLIPITVDIDNADLVENEYETEENLEGHLAKKAAPAGESSYKLGFLKPAEKDDEEKSRASEYVKKLDFTNDFAVNFAGQIVASSASLGDLVKTVSKEQETQISIALGKLKLEWGNCAAVGKPQLQVSFLLQKNGQNVPIASAGESVDLVMRAKNIGTGTFCKLVGVVASDEAGLKNREFVFGKLEPQIQREWKTAFKPPKSMVSEALPVTIKFYEEGPNTPSNFKAIIPITGLPQPRFAYSFKIGTPVGVKVAKDRLPEGKTIPLIVDVKNVGEGDADDVIAIIKNVESKGVFIDTGRIKIGRLERGQTKQAVLKFRLEPSFSDTVFNLELSIIDMALLSSLTKKIEFDVANSVATPAVGQWHQGPKIQFAAKFPVSVAVSKYHIEGDITDDQQVRDYFVFVGDEKVAYSSNPLQTGNYHISFDLPLKDGNNVVSVVGRDNQDMMTRYSFVVEKK